MTVHALRWFGSGRCLVADEESGETFTAARLVPGERATVTRFVRAGRRVPVADEILSPSPHRQQPACPLYTRCTGCDLLHVTEAEELRYKQLTVREVLERHAGIVVDRVETVGSGARGNHRARAHFAVAHTDAGIALGLRDFAGDVVDTTECPANTADVRGALRHARHLLAETPQAPVVAVEISAGVEGVGVLFDLPEGTSAPPEGTSAAPPDGDSPAPPEGTSAASPEGSFEPPLATLVAHMAGLEGVAAVGVRVGRGPAEVRAGRWPRQLPVGDIELDAAVDAWVQPTPEQAAALYGWVNGLALHHGARVLDATCGTGGLSLALAPDAATVLGVDANWSAVRSATASAARLGFVNARFRGGKIQTVAERLVASSERFDLTIVNPMRASLGDACMTHLATLTEDALLYLAPAPRAGAADLAVLRDAGFGVARVAAVNLHPGTSTVLMAVLMRRDRAPRTRRDGNT